MINLFLFSRKVNAGEFALTEVTNNNKLNGGGGDVLIHICRAHKL